MVRLGKVSLYSSNQYSQLSDKDQVWEAWDTGEIDDSIAAFAWWSIVIDWGQRIRDRSAGKDNQVGRRAMTNEVAML